MSEDQILHRKYDSKLDLNSFLLFLFYFFFREYQLLLFVYEEF